MTLTRVQNLFKIFLYNNIVTLNIFITVVFFHVFKENWNLLACVSQRSAGSSSIAVGCHIRRHTLWSCVWLGKGQVGAGWGPLQRAMPFAGRIVYWDTHWKSLCAGNKACPLFLWRRTYIYFTPEIKSGEAPAWVSYPRGYDLGCRELLRDALKHKYLICSLPPACIFSPLDASRLSYWNAYHSDIWSLASRVNSARPSCGTRPFRWSLHPPIQSFRCKAAGKMEKEPRGSSTGW